MIRPTAVPVLITLVLAAPRADILRAAVEPAPPGWQAESFAACKRDTCSFEDDTGSNRYVLADGILSRRTENAQVYARPITGKYESVLLVGMSGAGNQIVVVIARERISIRGSSGSNVGVPPKISTRERSGPTKGIHPKDVEREHRVEVVNPKSGDTIKFIDLGAFRPQKLALTRHGEQVLLAGEDLQLRSEEVRVYNTRSGKLEHQTQVAKANAVELAANGYQVEGRSWALSAPQTGEGQRFNSRDPYSIAEYMVACSGSLAGPGYQDKTLAVPSFKGVERPELAQMLTNGLALKLAGAGFQLAERERFEEILDELWLQTTGATSEEQAAELGRLANAQYLALGSLEVAGTTSSLTVRLVSVEEGRVVDGCEVACRDCRPDDYLEALTFLVQSWTGS